MNNNSFVVLISGTGSNLQAIIDATESGQINAQLSAVISNKASAPGLEKANKAGIKTGTFEAKDYPDKQSLDDALITYIDSLNPNLIVLAGYMRILTDDFVNHYENKIVNIHPSLLPKYKGLHTHKRVLEEGDTEHGASVHLVSNELDSGPVIIQAKTDVLSDDNEESLAAHVLKLEHKIYPIAIQWFFQNKLNIKDKQVYFENRLLSTPIQWKNDTFIYPN